MEDFINQRMSELASNIGEFNIGDIVFDQDGSGCVITSKTKNSLCVYIKSKTDKGIDHDAWFDMRGFNNRFKR